MSLKPREQQMLDLYDQGLSPNEIAKAMSIKNASVRRTLALLDAGPQQDLRHRRAVAAGSAELLKRIKAAGGHR